MEKDNRNTGLLIFIISGLVLGIVLNLKNKSEAKSESNVAESVEKKQLSAVSSGSQPPNAEQQQQQHVAFLAVDDNVTELHKDREAPLSSGRNPRRRSLSQAQAALAHLDDSHDEHEEYSPQHSALHRNSVKRRSSQTTAGVALSVVSVDESQDSTAKAILHATEKPHVSFDPSAASSRLNKMWSFNAEFGEERNPFNVYLEEIVTDRYTLVSGMQLLRDELQLTFTKTDFCSPSDAKYRTVDSCCADVTIPSVVCTVAHTNCGDRICQSSNLLYQQVVASRFASISELGETKPELFNPTGGGTDDGATLAHVTVRHMFHDDLRNFIYDGHRQSFSLVNFDIKTHCGKLMVGPQETIVERQQPMNGLRLFFGSARESIWRDARSACGALYGCLNGYNEGNAVHRRLRADLGEKNFAYLSSRQLLADDDSTPITYLVAAAIVALRGMAHTARALATSELDERGVGHCTASININSAAVGEPDPLLYLARCTVFQGVITIQGLGTDATKYSGSVSNSDLITLHYNGKQVDEYEVCRMDANSILEW